MSAYLTDDQIYSENIPYKPEEKWKFFRKETYFLRNHPTNMLILLDADYVIYEGFYL